MLATITFLLAAAVASAAPPATASCSEGKAFAGTICTPGTRGKHPAVLLLGGWEGANSAAPLLPRFVQEGYVAASVAYFRMRDLPPTLENVPVEAVGRALDAISKRPDVDARRIAIFGISKGGELALLAATVYPQIRAVVAAVPSPFAWEGIAAAPGAPQSSWTVGGEPFPYVEFSSAMDDMIHDAYMQHKPVHLRAGYDASMQRNRAEIPGAMFHLENIHGPVLMLGADDDQFWNSDAQAEIGMKYLRDHHHPYADAYLHYSGAGHLFLAATSERPMTQAPMGQTMTLVFGGTPDANVEAAKQAWPKVYAFLQAALQAAVVEPGK